MGSDSTSLVTCAFCCIFQSTLPGWGATATEINRLWPQLFQSTLPGWGATSSPLGVATTIARFQSTLPGWGATHRPELRGQSIEKISIHAPRMGSDFRLELYCCRRRISIHAPRMGSDHTSADSSRNPQHFNPRSPDGERRADSRAWISRRDFNPRSPDGERPELEFRVSGNQAISIHAPRMGSDARLAVLCSGEQISIHAPRMGSDSTSLVTCVFCWIFQSTLPGWGATTYGIPGVSIPKNFNPRSPDGERPDTTFTKQGGYSDFNPRSPDGERLDIALLLYCHLMISIHAPRMGSDLPFRAGCTMGLNFNPRSPDGERLHLSAPHGGRTKISIHAPRMGSDHMRV